MAGGCHADGRGVFARVGLPLAARPGKAYA
jgi:hypothetical protein